MPKPPMPANVIELLDHPDAPICHKTQEVRIDGVKIPVRGRVEIISNQGNATTLKVVVEAARVRGYPNGPITLDGVPVLVARDGLLKFDTGDVELTLVPTRILIGPGPSVVAEDGAP